MVVDEPAVGRFSIGVMLPVGQGLAVRDLVALAQRAEAAGLDAVGIGEYASTEAFALCAAIASVTERIQIETGVIAVTSRSAPLLAMGAATLDDLSSGRFTLGLGAGSPVVASFHDRAFSAPVQTVASAVDDVRALLAGERVANRFGLRLPLQGGVRLLLSALNPAMLRLAATTDGVLLPLLCSPKLVRQLATVVSEERGRLGRQTPFAMLAINHAMATGNRHAAHAVLRREVAGYFVVPTYRRAALDLVGEEGLAAAISVHRDGGIDALAAWIPDEAVEPILVHGGGDQLGERIDQLVRAGCTGVRFNPLTPTKGDASAGAALIDALATLVAAQPPLADGPHRSFSHRKPDQKDQP